MNVSQLLYDLSAFPPKTKVMAVMNGELSTNLRVVEKSVNNEIVLVIEENL